ncbi:MAG: outer membrane protein assembly factor BamC [Gammaproteobacteria bacterium]|uniref:outer membrane protein assembly factor BamC n=1 Tax=Rhodoferax sp. TaxID=50421 RepID=UPI001794C128|nr:outer membrane protein assembly factor BamC [Rhodoferax sp.]MBU3899125.1 outer membrane protein assembly factor BamC [Gammaproteobacteria bacterium]MBA3057404.1 outer membrane protein assembly factor BamC [Rhodoferax sp.]MBU3996221.1 outer membrane protein assembly factor BamC [Gammaproteobacteria bacterium]MBU4018569.1 outer membrane protein assembly factor BamC [Gammaproteobacteria bacterium]MBU4080581.1 outer membrane protein assembly factor BamC [Gammaproteobacteria bacterium]
MNHFSRLSLLSLSLTLAACSVLDGDKIDYKSASKKGTSLEVPPDLTQLSRETRYAVPGSAVSASSFQLGQVSQTVPTATASTTMGDVRIERAGNQRWLVINRPADLLWEPVRDFWQENGFLLAMDQANLGIMETDWAENRAKIPQDFIRNTLGKVLDSLYSTGERDKFRTRLERNASGGTDIFISHRGMIEVYNSNDKDSTVWQPRPADPELEAEFLRRLMVKLGVSQEQSKALLAAGANPSSSRATAINGQPVVQIDDGFDRAWRRVGLSLDRTGFTVEDRDRAKGIYFVRYVAPSADKAEPGFLGKLFGGSKAAEGPLKYRIAVVSQGTSTTVSVLDANGRPDTSANAQRIVNVIAADLK